MIVRVRVRGVYATALTKLFMKYGFQIVQASDIISHRFGIPQISAPADVTVKSDERNPSRLLIIGYPKAVASVEEVLKTELPYSFYWRAKLPLYATVRAKIVGVRNGSRCIAKVGDIEALIEIPPEECREGEEVPAYVARTAFRADELPLLRPGVRVVGDYASIYVDKYRGPKVTFSEHIRSTSKRAELLTISEPYTSRGISVHWRSNAKFADRRELEGHLRELAAKLDNVLSSPGDATLLSEGEDLVLVELSYVDKQYCDELRGAVVPTAPLHHALKSTGDDTLSMLIDFADKLVEHEVDKHKIEKALYSFLTGLIREHREVRILHVKPYGEEIAMRASVFDVHMDENGSIKLILRRVVKSSGVYDGLGVEKEPGDTIQTTVTLGSWYIKHEYYSRDGVLKGIYININTPPELWLNTIKYLDLEVDVVKTSNESKIIEVEGLLKALEDGIITKRLACRALEEALKHGQGASNLEEVNRVYVELCKSKAREHERKEANA